VRFEGGICPSSGGLEHLGESALRNPLHLFPPVNVNATTLPLEGEIRGEAQLQSLVKRGIDASVQRLFMIEASNAINSAI